MRLLEMVDLADMLGRMRELETDALAMPAGREAPAPDHRPCKGGKVQLGGRHTSVPLQRTSRVPRTRPASSSSPCLRRPARERCERYSEARGRPWDSQPRPSRFTASRQRLVTGASEPRYRRTSRASSNHTQGLITWPLSTSLPIACQPGRRLRAKISRYGAGHSRSMPSFASSGFWLCWRRGAMISSRTSRRNRWTPLPGCSWPVGSWAAELTTFVR